VNSKKKRFEKKFCSSIPRVEEEVIIFGGELEAR
jgi:hypothetical protein